MYIFQDYIDAFEKLLRLGLKSSQQQEIVLVILDCCLQEKKYNPFYSYLGQKFCEHHRSFQVSKLTTPCPVNVWLGKLTALDMTPLGWLGRKTATQTNNIIRNLPLPCWIN